jgi:phosphatidylglycerol lysyltransferase
MSIAFPAATPPPRLPARLPINVRVSRAALLALRFLLLAFAIWSLRRELAGVHPNELARQLASYGWRHAVLAVAATVASFLALGLVEALALRCSVSRARVPRRAAMATAFVAHAFSQSIGFALLTGAAVRLRAYARYRLDPASVARTSAFVTLTITLGLLACGGGALIASSAPLRVVGVALPARPAGVALLLVVAAYVMWSLVTSRDQLRRAGWLPRRPTVGIASAQLLLSCTDWLLTASVLFAVLPRAAGLGFGELLRVYLIAQMIGMVSHVPGGAGVFEAVMLTLTARGSASQQAAVVAALVSFRIVYYLLPLVVAFAVAAIAELRQRDARLAPLVIGTTESMEQQRAG